MQKVKKHPHAGKQGPVRDFLKLVQEISSHRNYWEVFEDFLELSYCALAKTTYPKGDEESERLEARYMERVSKREKDYVRRMPELLGLCYAGLQQGGDFLGDVAGDLGVLNSQQGQFFTPWEVCKLMAAINLTGIESVIEKQGFVTMQEPASGAGGLVLACARMLEDLGFIPECHMIVDAIDVNNTAFQMTYVQLALSDIPANVYRGDTIRWEFYEAQITPAKIAFVGRHGKRWEEYVNSSRKEAKPQEPNVKLGQMDLFGEAS